MKIQIVRFKNLNSLSGEWRIDFTDPNFTSSGIFAIVGATGAGKSTILDAISLALYGRTPRLKQVSKSTNEIMSRQSGECFSEVEFISSKGRFRTHWSQHRARKKANGELQPPKHEFADADSGKILASKLKDVAAEVSDATGMDFEQFTRSMLLAQGDFSKFLQANSDERAPILEQITGTAIYSRISKQIHLQYSEEKQKLELQRKALENLNILSDQEIAELRSSQVSLRTAIAQLQKEIATTTAGLNWHQNLEKLRKQEVDLTRASLQLRQQWDASAPLQERLKKAQQCQILQGNYTHLRHLRRAQKEETTLLEVTTRQVVDGENIVEKLQQQTKTLDQQYQKWFKEEQGQKTVIQQVRQLDYELQKLHNEEEKLRNSRDSQSQEIKKLTERQTESNTHLNNCHKTIVSLQKFLTKHAEDEPLVEHFSGIEEKGKQLLRIYSQLKNLNISVLEGEKKLNEGKKDQKQLTEKLSFIAIEEKQHIERIRQKQTRLKETAPQGKSSLYKREEELHKNLASLKENTRLLTELRSLQQKEKREQEKKLDLRGRITSLQKELTQTQSLFSLQKGNVAKQEEIILLEHKIADFEAERKELKPDTPCPLCGSKEHPFVTNRTHQNLAGKDQLTKEKEKLEALNQQTRKQEIELTKLQQSELLCTESLAETAATLSQTEKQIKESKDFFTDEKELETASATVEAELKKAVQNKEQADAIARNISTDEESLKQLVTRITDLKEALSDKQRHQDKLNTEITQQQRTVESLESDSTQILQALTQYFNGENTYAFDTAETINQSLYRLKEKITKFKGTQISLQEQQSQLQQLTNIHEQLTHALTLQRAELEKLEQNTKLLAQEKNALQVKRKTLFGDKSPDAEEQRLQSNIEKSSKLHKESQQNLTAKEKELTALIERKENLHKSLTKKSNDLLSEEDHFRSLLQQQDFETEESFLQARLNDEERDKMNTQLQRLQTQLLETETKLGAIREELEQTTAENVSTLTLDMLKAKLEEQNNQHGELQQQLGAVTEQIKASDTAIEQQKEKQLQLQLQEKEFDHWAQLHTLIGSADGKKFRNFAQGLTFELMVRHANQTLDKMSDRYLLKRLPHAPLELAVIDAYQAGETRSTVNLSGGETFIISLALALGLSAMASKKVQIDSLFLDEGFGTLDEESLEIALETLSTLQQRGKIIGIISHVPLLKERIDVQLRLTSGLDGNSTISGPGVTHF